MTNVRARIAETRWEEVKTWDAGFGFRSPNGGRPCAGRGIRIPSLEEILRAFPTTFLNVDLKAPLADAAVVLLRREAAEARVCLASFRAATLRRVRALGYAGPTSLARIEVARLLALPAVVQRGALAPPGDAAQLPVSLMRPFVLERCRALGLRVDCWTVNDPGLVPRLVALGVDGIMTDDPRKVAPALALALRDAAARS
jgi:glycerophosphoryl diester phosphodiesterase